MSIMVPSLTDVTPADGSRSTGRRVIRKRTRTIIRKTLEKLKVLRRIDDREEARATMLVYNPVLIKKSKNSAEDRAFLKCMDRLQELLDMVL